MRAHRPGTLVTEGLWCYGDGMRPAAFLQFVAAAAIAAGPQLEFPVAGVQAPALIKKVDPEYTQQAKKARIEGTVLLYVKVGTDGRAHRIQVLKGLGYGLDAKAIAAMHRWRFRPGRKNGVPVVTPATIEVKFRLVDAPELPLRV